MARETLPVARDLTFGDEGGCSNRAMPTALDKVLYILTLLVTLGVIAVGLRLIYLIEFTSFPF